MALRSASTFISFLILLYFLNFLCINAATYREILQIGQSVGISDTIVSYDGNFEFGFFSRTREKSTKYYIGIWFKKVPNDKIVWVANREYPFQTSAAVFTIQHDGNMVIMDGPMTYLVNSVSNDYSTYAKLLDSGNLVLLNNSNQAILWQSFDYPTDTLLPGMNLGLFNNVSLKSWKSVDDPAPGPFSFLLDIDRSRHYVNRVKNSTDYTDQIDIVINDKGSNSRLVLEVSGELNFQRYLEEIQRWISQLCGSNHSCGAFSICNPQAFDPCSCLPGFEPRDADSWRPGEKSAGCVREMELSCGNTSSESTDGFLSISMVEFPSSKVKEKMETASRCERTCSSSCSCVGFVYDFNGICHLYVEPLLSLKNISTDVGNANNNNPSFYLRLAALELYNNTVSNTTNAFGGRKNRMRNLLRIVVPISFLTLLILVGLFIYWIRRKRCKGEDLLHFEVGKSMKVKDLEFPEADKGVKVKKKEVKLPLFSFVSVVAATNDFLDANKLGEGGFGPVYKGKLLNGDEVAIKRLSRRSGQGWEELRNEALLIAKLQHNNLVRLLGCCIDGNEKMLIYEFMPNKSLDYFLFDATKGKMLDWGTRVRIIDGIVQGLLYLHQYSRFRIIHRDLKASNILLDINMNPKISDFGLARIFGENELEANTNRIVGTYGYMSPEYAMDGLFSIKSDVFSFGVLLLEIVSGKKNTGFYQTNSLNLLGYVWDLWTNNLGMNLMDPTLEDISSQNVVPKYVNIGLLCVQENPADRPTMFDIVAMMSNDTTTLPSPKPPAFLNVRGDEIRRLAKRMEENFSVNVVTESVVEAR